MYFINEIVSINYSGYTMMEATFNLLNVAMKKEYDWF